MTTLWQLRPTAVIGSATLVAVATVIFSLSYRSDVPLNGLENCYVFIDRLKKSEFAFIYANVGSLLASIGFSREGRRWESRNVTIRSSFRGIDASSLTKNITEEVSSNPNSNLQALLSWREPQQHVKTLPLSRFSAFLPPHGNIHGNPWWLLEAKHSRNSDGHVEVDVYEPPTPGTPAEVLLGELFGMFHQNVFLTTRASPAGTAAVVTRSRNSTLDILFRSHVEFQISTSPQRPLWFTPAQFQGRVVISEDGSVLHHFEAHVPTDRQLNVDLEWLSQRYSGDAPTTEVDIGKVAEMVLNLETPNGPPMEMRPSSISSNEEDKALRKLHQMFFPFLKDYAASETDQATKKMAAACLSEYKFPVQIVCLLPNATVVDSICANDLLAVDDVDEVELQGFTDPIEMAYHQFLSSCITKARTKHLFEVS